MKALIIEDSLELANSLVNFFRIDGHVTDHAEAVSYTHLTLPTNREVLI